MILTGLLAASAALSCANPQTQSELNACAARGHESADMALNAEWKRTTAAANARDRAIGFERDRRPGHHAALLAAQRAWLAYRDAHCRTEGYRARGGSMEPMLVSQCLEKLTRDRTDQLRALAKAED